MASLDNFIYFLAGGDMWEKYTDNTRFTAKMEEKNNVALQS